MTRWLRLARWIPTLAALALAAACTPRAPVEAVTAPDPVAGRKLYERACADCHGADGRGHGPRAAELEQPVPDLTLLAQRNGGTFPDQRLFDVLSGRAGVKGHDTRAMPVWQSLTRPTKSGADAVASLYQQIRLEEVATYLEGIQRVGTTGPEGRLSDD